MFTSFFVIGFKRSDLKTNTPVIHYQRKTSDFEIVYFLSVFFVKHQMKKMHYKRHKTSFLRVCRVYDKLNTSDIDMEDIQL